MDEMMPWDAGNVFRFFVLAWKAGYENGSVTIRQVVDRIVFPAESDVSAISLHAIVGMCIEESAWHRPLHLKARRMGKDGPVRMDWTGELRIPWNDLGAVSHIFEVEIPLDGPGMYSFSLTDPTGIFGERNRQLANNVVVVDRE